MWKLVTEQDNARWAYKDNSQIYCPVVWLMERKDYLKYHLIDENKDEIPCDVESHLVEEQIWNEQPFSRDEHGNPII